jgi:hypothetical protein
MESNLTVSIDPALVELAAGAETTARVIVENRSQFVGQYQLAAAALDGATITFDPDQLGIFPGSNASATLRVRAAASMTPATYPAVVRAINQNDPSEEARAMLKINVRGTGQRQSASTQSGVPPPDLPEMDDRAGRPMPFSSPEHLSSTPDVVTTPPRTQKPATDPIIIFAGDAALRGTSPGAAQLEVGIDRNGVTLLPGARLPLNVRVRNNGGIPLSVELSTLGLPPAWANLDPLSLDLAPGQVAGARLALTPPADSPSGSYPLSLIVTDRGTPSISVQLDVIVEIGEPGGLLLELSPQRIETQVSAQVLVRITQSGDAPLNVSLEASDAEDAAAYTFDPVSVYVPAGASGTTKLTIRARKGLTGVDTHTVAYTVTGTTAEGATKAASAQGFFIQKQTPAIALSLSPVEQTAPDQAVYTVGVGNPSQVQTTVKLTASDADAGCRFQFNPAALTVQATGQAQSTLTVSPLRLSTLPAPILHNFTVRAEPSGELLLPAEATAKYSQTAMDLPALTLMPASQSSSGAANYTVQVANRRAVPIDVELRAFDPSNMVTLALQPATLRIAPNGQARAKLGARPTSGLLKGETRRSNEFTVEARIAGIEDAASTKGTLVQQAGANLLRFLPILVGLLVIVCVCGVAAFMFPKIQDFFGAALAPVKTLVAQVPTSPGFNALPTFTPTPTLTPTPVPPTPTTDLGPFAVKGLTAKVSPASANACPANFTFSADITVNRAGSLTYVWEFTNGTATAPKVLNFTGPGTQTVTQAASFNVNGPGGGHVKVTSPPSPDSNQATVTLNCPDAPTAKPATAAPGSTPTKSPTPPPAAATNTLPPPAISVAGNWVHNFGNMTLAQTGNNVTGTYLNAFGSASGTINGTLTGNVLTGNWNISGGTGTIAWTFNPGNGTFTGNWNSSVLWCGARVGNALPANCGFSGAWSIRLNGGTRTMNMTQTGTSVTGTYFNGTNNGTISGNISYTGGFVVLNGTWTVPSAGTSGPMHFFYNDFPSNSFQGNFNTSSEWCGFRNGAPQPSPCLKN